MSDDIHPDEFGGTDDESHLLTQAVLDMSQPPMTPPCPREEAATNMRAGKHMQGFDARRLPDLEHVGPLQSGSLRLFVGVDPLVGSATTFADGRMHVGVDMGARDSTTVVRFADGRTIEIDEHTAGLIADYQADQATMARLGALTRWLDTSARSFEDAVAIGQAAGLDTDHAQRLATIAGFKQVTIVRFESDGDEDATRVAAVLWALGYTATRVMSDPGARDRWALAELARRYSLSPSEHDVAAQKLGLGTCWIKEHRYIEERMMTKLAGKTLAQAMAEIAEVQP